MAAIHTGELYNDLGGDYYRKRDPGRITKCLVAQLESLGHHVILEERPHAPSAASAQVRADCRSAVTLW